MSELDPVVAALRGATKALAITGQPISACAAALEGPRRTACLLLAEQIADAQQAADRIAVCVQGDLRYELLA